MSQRLLIFSIDDGSPKVLLFFTAVTYCLLAFSCFSYYRASVNRFHCSNLVFYVLLCRGTGATTLLLLVYEELIDVVGRGLAIIYYSYFIKILLSSN